MYTQTGPSWQALPETSVRIVPRAIVFFKELRGDPLTATTQTR
jgi:hypothetical protein